MVWAEVREVFWTYPWFDSYQDLFWSHLNSLDNNLPSSNESRSEFYFSLILSVMRVKGKPQNGCYKKTKNAKFSEKRIFLTPWHAHARRFQVLFWSHLSSLDNNVPSSNESRSEFYFSPILSVIRLKGESQNGCYKKTKYAKFSKTLLPTDTYTCVCVSGSKKCSFFGKFGVLVTPILRSVLLPYYQRFGLPFLSF